MAGKPRGRAIGVRYDEGEILARIERLRRERGLEAKEIYAELGMDKGQWSRKARGLVAFSLLEFSRIADLLEAPAGWPFIPAELGELIERLKK